MGLWSCCWRNWNIFNLARNQKKDEKKEKTWRLIFPLPNVCGVHKQTHRLCFTAVFSSSCYWQYIFISLRTWVLDSQDSIVWSGRRKNKHGDSSSFWKFFHHVDIFSATWLCFTRKSFQWTGPNVCKQCCATCVIYFRFAQSKNKLRFILVIRFVLQSTPSLAQPRIPLPFFCPPQSCILSLSCPRFALFCLKSRLSNYQRLACRVVTLDWVI